MLAAGSHRGCIEGDLRYGFLDLITAVLRFLSSIAGRPRTKSHVDRRIPKTAYVRDVNYIPHQRTAELTNSCPRP